MDMSGSHRIEASREAVWAALNDPEILRQCIPGCEEVVRQSDTEMTARVVAKVGPVSAKFAGKVTLSDLDPPNGYTITGEGSGGAAGFGKGGATVALSDDGGATLLTYTAKAQVGGKLAQIGSRLVDATARKMAEEFFARFTQIVGPAPAEAVPVEAAPAEAAPQPVVRPAVYSDPTPAAGPAAKPAARVAEPPPEIPLPLPIGRGAGVGGGNFYVPWAALLVVVVLLASLAWMN
ncbi:carbon monoxide dehydrogenase subunit G [Azospirillum lipoferum]|uniref:Carbon monoxide dehydrogenase subunit G n=1 Tax=Azospirillum lipoferum TaxID=193 RepID=A0A5A9GJP1_AZOLI|nr:MULTISPECIES: carbon monoxide dehydrogenase subunit G [Azospirillum]KAA0594708.1 carbon monoxide dehydrogenase subunit G [Azospirillum lipoferum]MCP1612985.1 carbon monoxide dehydrogenase subunit G [Azospirillum lipoferum]MDW5532825.1 carbon monoxide dehydrogenase subunit G [Azospirillum sp. NL1]